MLGLKGYNNDMRKVLLLPLCLLIIAAAGSFLYYAQSKNTSSYLFAPVVRGAMRQEILASGNVQSPTTIELHFKNSGELVALRATIGQTVHAGEVLASQDDSALRAQLDEANAAVDAQAAQLNKLQTGPRKESVAVAQAALDVARQSLANIYAGVPTALQGAEAKARDAVSIQIAPFFSNADTATPSLTFSTSDSQAARDLIALRVDAARALDSWSTAGESAAELQSDIAYDLDRLSKISNLLSTALQTVSGNTSLSSGDAATYRIGASTGYSEVTAALQSLQSLQQSILAGTSAEAKAQADLDLASAATTESDIEAGQAALAGAKAHAASLAAQLQDLSLVAPIGGVITDTNGDVGEVITPSQTVVSLMPQTSLQLKVNVSEDKIVGVSPGQQARVELDAIPNEDIPAVVVSVDPGETLLGGAVYYKTTLNFLHDDPRIRPGMSANVWIETGNASSTLIVPASALHQNNGSTYVSVKQNSRLEERQVVTGLRDSEGNVEITAGLKDGDQVVTGQ